MSEIRDEATNKIGVICQDMLSRNEENGFLSIKELGNYIEKILSIPEIAVVDRENFGLPDNVRWHRVEREFEAYCAGRNDMLGDGWVKEVKE